MSQKRENTNLDKDEDFQPIIIQKRNYSPNNPDRITQSIVQYVEDPKESKALAKIKELSISAKKQSSNDDQNELDDIKDFDVLDNTEKNKIMFQEPKNERALKVNNIVITKNNNNNTNFMRRTFQFPTQTYIPKHKNMSLFDEIKPKINNYEFKENQNNNYELKFDLDMPELYEDRTENNEDIKKEDENNNKNNIIKNKTNYSKITTEDKNKTKNNQNYLRRDKKLNTEMNVKRVRFADSLKPGSNYLNNRESTEPINDVRASFNPTLTEEYKKKNNVTIENINNKEKLVINEYPTTEKNKKQLKKYKTEYIWDKNINRLVEKRIYIDKDNEPIKSITKNEKILNEDKYNDDINVKKKEEIYENEEKEEPEEKPGKIKVNLKYKKIDDDNKQKESENKKIEIRKRFGNSQMIYKKDIKDKKNEKLDNNKVNNNVENPNKELNRSYRFHRFKNYKTNKELEKPKEEEIIIEKKTVIKIEQEIPKEENNEQINEKEKEKEKEENNVKEENNAKEENNIQIKDNEKIPKKVEESKETIRPNLYRRRNYYLKKKENKEEELEKEPEKKQINEKKKLNLTEVEDEPKYKKKPKFETLEQEPVTIIYSKKIKVEEKKPVKETKEEIPEKKFEKYKEKESLNPYNKNKKKNIRINMMSDKFDDDKDKQKIKNNPYSNYLKNSKKTNNDRNIYKQVRADSELIDDLEKIENYNVSTYLKNDLLQIYDSINQEFSDFKNDIFYTNINSFEINMGEFDKKQIPIYKKTKKADDLCRGRVTTDDMYKKYSKKAKRFEREKKYK